MEISDYLRESSVAMNKIFLFEEEIETLASQIWKKLENDGTIYWMGNGGSAGDSQHLATELVGRFARNRKPLKSISLTTNTSLLTALANDDGYETVFSRQVDAFVNASDVVIGISTSGRSENILKALEIASLKGALVVSFTGESINGMDRYSNYVFHAPSEVTGVIQQMHITFGQALCLALENKVQV
jgi:D-sedoheptulose 7-phosphate isomerase